eukprot:jgi/Tetstr1/449450/TSEL_036545.t1
MTPRPQRATLLRGFAFLLCASLAEAVRPYKDIPGFQDDQAQPAGASHSGLFGRPHPSVLRGGGARSAGCDLCEQNWLFILGAGGRTGTTTALSMFDSVPGIELTGEHWGFLNEEALVLEKLMKAASKPCVSGTPAPDVDGFMCDIQERTRRTILGARHDELLASSRVIGFKEIRYTSPTALRFLARVFPCARLVFTYRRKPHVEVRASEFQQEHMRQQWEESHALFDFVHSAFNDTIGMLAVEALTLRHYNRLLTQKLGVRGCEFAKIIHDNAGGGYSRDRDRPDDGVLVGECDLSGVDFRHGPSELAAREARWDELTLKLASKQRRHHLAAGTSRTQRDETDSAS